MVELLVVLAILAVLAAVAVPAFIHYRKGAVDSEMRSAIHTARNAMESYYEANEYSYESATLADLEAEGFPPGGEVTLVILATTPTEYSLRACRQGGSVQSFKFENTYGLIIGEDVPCS